MDNPVIKVAVTASTAQATAQLEEFGARSKAAMDAYNAAAAKGKSTSEALGMAFDKAMSQGLGFTASMESATASVNSYTGSADKATAANRGITSSFYAAQGAAGLLEGRLPYRALERFLASSKGVSNVLMAAFPVIGAIALGEVLVRTIGEMVKLGSAAAEFSRETGSGWLDGAIAQVDGLAAALKQADKEQMKLAQNLDSTKQKLEQDRIENIRLTKGAPAADYAKAGELQQRIDAIEKLKAVQLSAAEQYGQLASSQAELDRVGSQGILQHRIDQSTALRQYNALLATENELVQRKNNLYIEAQHAESKSAPGRENLAAEHAAERKAEREKEAIRKNFEEKGKFRKSLEKSQPKHTDLTTGIDLASYYDKPASAFARYREQVDKGNQAMIENAAKIKLEQVALDEQSGAISKVTADHRRGAIEAKMYSGRIDELSQRLKQLQFSTPQAAAEGKLPQAEAEIQRLKNQIAQLQSQQQVAGMQNQGKTAQDISQPFVNGINTINNAWLGMQNKLIFGTQFVARQFQNMGVSILESGAAWVEKWLAQKALAYLKDRVLHQVSEQIKTTQTAAAAAASKSIASATNVANATGYMAVAVTGAAASQAPIPIVGPELAAAAAASMTAMLTPFVALAAFERGGIITGPTMALMGEAGSEAVLPHRLTTMLMAAANHYGGDTNTSSTSIHSTANFNGITDRNFREMARRHSDVIAESVHHAIRSGKVRIA